MLRALRRHLLLWTASMVGSEEPVMRWAVFTTLCSDLRFATEQLPYHTEMQFVRIIDIYVYCNDALYGSSSQTGVRGPLGVWTPCLGVREKVWLPKVFFILFIAIQFTKHVD